MVWKPASRIAGAWCCRAGGGAREARKAGGSGKGVGGGSSRYLHRADRE